MKYLKPLILISCVMLVAAACNNASISKPGKALVIINNEPITDADLEFIAEVNPRLKAQIQSPMGRKSVLNNMIEQRLLYQDSIKKGLDKSSEVKDKIDLYRQVIISQAAMDKALDEAARKYYEENKNEYNKLKLAHIQVDFETPADATEKKDKKDKKKEKKRSEAEALSLAQKVHERLKAGEKFGDLTKEVSDDKLTKNREGDLGRVSIDDKRIIRRGMKPVLTEAFKMKVNDYSQPIKSDNAYHIIMVTEAAKVDPFDKVEQGITFKIQGKVKNDYMTKLKKDATITYPEEKKKAEEKKPKK